jgi:UDP-2,4-diacetamido-2,4,6-trideoxy-beta-L-altropyranose hydrolase
VAVQGVGSFLFRCDASAVIGVGHFMRCYSLAVSLRGLGHEVRFAMRDATEHALALLRDGRFECVSLPSLPGDLEAELPRLKELLRGVSCVLVDHYRASAAYLAALRATGVLVAVIDDVGDRDLTAAGWLLNPNPDAARRPYRIDPACACLFGPAFALLRPQFATARASARRHFTAADRRVLLTLGGGDTAELCRDLLTALDAGPGRRLEVRCLAGGDGLDRLRAAAHSSRHQVEILHNVADVAPHMLWADLSVNAGGSTCWELCCLGVPMLVLVLSADQRGVAASLEGTGAAVGLVAATEAGEVVEALLAAPGRRARLSAAAQALVDGRGADRAAAALVAAAEGARDRHEPVASCGP